MFPLFSRNQIQIKQGFVLLNDLSRTRQTFITAINSQKTTKTRPNKKLCLEDFQIQWLLKQPARLDSQSTILMNGRKIVLYTVEFCCCLGEFG